MPNVFALNGKWYLTCLTGNYYGNRGGFDDPYIANGTMFAVSDRPEGPYRETGDNVLLGATHDSPITVRAFEFQGEMHILYTDRERAGHTNAGELTFGTISTPKLLRTRGEQLYVAYSPRIESEIIGEPIGRDALPGNAQHRKALGATLADARCEMELGRDDHREFTLWLGHCALGHCAESFIFEVDLELTSGLAAGLAIRLGQGQDGAVVAVDANAGEVFFGTTAAL